MREKPRHAEIGVMMIADRVEDPRRARCSRSSRRACTGYVEAAGRLVHQHQTQLGDEIARDLQPLPHAARIGAGPSAIRN